MHKTKTTQPEAEATAQAETLSPVETTAQADAAVETTVEPAPPARELPKVGIRECLVDGDRITIAYELQGRLADPRDLIRAAFADELPAFKKECPDAQRHEVFKQRLEETARDLAEAEAAVTAAEKSWKGAIHAGGDVAGHERNTKDARLRLEIIRERQTIQKNKQKEIEQAMFSAWQKRLDLVVRARRAKCEETIAQAREYFTRDRTAAEALVTLSDEVRLATTLALGVNGVFGLSPNIF